MVSSFFSFPRFALQTFLALVLGLLVVHGGKAGAQADPSSELRIIQASFQVERRPGEDDFQLSQRLHAVVAVSNLQLAAIGYTLAMSDVLPQDAIAGANIFEVLKAKHSEWRAQQSEADVHIVVLNGVRGDRNYGVAFPGTACQDRSRNSIVVTVDRGSSQADVQFSGLTLAHEIGHFLGASHDNTNYDNQFSLMHANAHAVHVGFSGFSRAEIAAHASFAQGDHCFHTEIVSGAAFAITGPERVTVREGESTVHYFKVEGAAQPVVLRADGLPGQFAFTPHNGELRVSAAALAAGLGSAKPMRILLSALTFSAEAHKEVIIEVVTTERAPEFSDGPLTQLTAKRRVASFKFGFGVSSPENRKVKVKCETPRGLRARTQTRRGVTTVGISGRVFLPQPALFACIATDSAGLTAKKIIALLPPG